ncbi:MAG: anhydro-N-acetylmuramic acid [Prolixibacteraceae bacterium]|nr:MAG: anhydro-N-acetylmuramic acid [Prolixibacteraceae bacterium]
MKPHSKNSIKVVGLMSGTSLDGLDLVAVEFWQTGEKWQFKIEAAETLEYSAERKNMLKNAPELSGMELIQLHTEYGHFLGNETKRFIAQNHFQPDIVASHGHTIFHQPEKGFTFQAGSGFEIAAITGITTVADFRSGDVALGGQGAPLVPVGDRFLFSEYEYCLNLGGFANISFEKNEKRVAFDICPVNIVLNYFAEKQGFAFDKNGELGRNGKVNTYLLEKLNQLDFYLKEPPKSLGREWVEQVFMPVLNDVETSANDKLRTVYEHIAQQISGIVSGVEKGGGEGGEKDREREGGGGKMLVTGGGAFNVFLIELISEKTQIELVIPAKEIINFKEALIFAFLGVLKFHGEINCLTSVTGAKCDSSVGIMYFSSNI